ncbi:MAG: hypothetical protein QXR48_01835 [Candidatus Woesearchaeota archaeon]
MAYIDNDYKGFIEELDGEELAELADVLSCSGQEGTPLEGIVQNTVIQERVDVIRRGFSILIYDRFNKSRVWINTRTKSKQAFSDILHDEISKRIYPLTDVVSYYVHKAHLESDD